MTKAIPIIVLLLGLSVYVYFARIRPGRSDDPVVRGSGTIEATEVVVSAKVPARLIEVRVSEGDRVTVGQVVATLDCADLEVRRAQADAQVAQAQAARVQAQAGHKHAMAQLAPLQVQHDLAVKQDARVRGLFAAASATQQDLDQAQAQQLATLEQLRAAELGAVVAGSAVDVANAQVVLAETTRAFAQTQLAECTLIAPMAGVVMSRTHEPGELVLPGASIVKLGRFDQVYTWLYVPNAEIGRVRLGQRVDLVADTYPDRTFTGTVARINDEAEFTPKSIQTKEDRTRLVYGVKVVIDNSRGELLAGMPVEAIILETILETILGTILGTISGADTATSGSGDDAAPR